MFMANSTSTGPAMQGWPPGLKRETVGLWVGAALIGAVGGYATLALAPIAIGPELVALVVLAWARPRAFGLAGAVVGHGLPWCGLLLASPRVCRQDVPAQCVYSLPFGPAHSADAATWMADTTRWIIGALLILSVGLVLTAVAARRLRTHRPPAPTRGPIGRALSR